MAEQKNDLAQQRAAALNAVTEAFDGNSKLAKKWINSPIDALGGERPIDYLNSIQRIGISF